jgi:hypothetical protein
VRFISVVVLAALSSLAAFAADADTDAGQTPATNSSSSVTSSEVSQLKARIAEQQAQLDKLKKVLADETQLLDAISIAPPAEPLASRKPLGEIATTTAMIPPEPPAVTPVTPLPVPQAAAAAETSPLQIKIGDATITPVGFMDLTNTWRSTNAGTSLQTNFGSFPYNNVSTGVGRLTEDKFSAENSRLGLRIDATVKGAKVLGYFEGDFVGLGNAALNTQVSSNSMLFRIRQYYVDVRKGFWEVLAGQAWSMILPNRKGMSPLPADLFYTQVVDVNYTNGLFWGRIPGIRVIGHPSNKVTFGIAAESSTQYFGGSGGGGTPVLPAALSTIYNSQVDNGVNNDRTTPNVLPDIIAKIVYEPSSRFHVEVGGVTSTFKTFNPLTQLYYTKTGGGATFALNAEIVKNFRFVTNNFWSDGDGRFLFGAAPDFVIRADGSPSLVHSGSTVTGFEATIKNFAPYAYYGAVYIDRNTGLDLNGTTPIGYGFTGSANSQNRTIQEITMGWTHTLWRDGKYGALQWMAQYAYFVRNPWYVAPGAPKNAHEDAIWFNLRYVLPGTAPTIKY